MSLMRWRCFLELGKTTKHPPRNACDCRSVWTMLTGNKSPKSTYLPATIWLIVFARIGKKPGPTTKGCWRSGPEGKLATKELSLNGTGREVPAVIEVLKIGECGVANVATKEGTVKLGLLWDAEGEGTAVPAVVPEKGPQKLRTSPFVGTNWAIERERPQKLTVTPRKLNYQAKRTPIVRGRVRIFFRH